MNFINNINKYLIERYPTIWNTRIVWMLVVSLLVHILFFVVGYVSHSNPASMQNNRVYNDYYNSGMIMVQIIISLLMLVSWLVFLFKNNAFKNFYPTSNLKLFGQFMCYLVIIFASITFHFSYMIGFQTYVKSAYPDNEMAKNVTVINKAYPFLSIDYQDYMLNKRAYPKQVKDLFCETDKNQINWNKKYFKNRDDVFQFYTLYKVAVTERDEYRQFKFPAKEYNNNVSEAYKKIDGDTCFYFFKKDVVDVSPYIKTAELSYYNFSKIFYELNSKDVEYDRYNSSYYDTETAISEYNDESKNAEFNKQLIEVLDRNNPEEIKKIMNDFIEVSTKYKINNNLNTDEWFKMIYHPENFEVKHFINTNETGDSYLYPPQSVPYDTLAATTVTNAVEVAAEQAATVAVQPYSENTNYNYYNRNLSKTYYQVNNLKDFLRNVELMKNSNVFKNVIHVYLWIAFVLSTLIFSFRVTNLRSVIFTGVTVGVLSLTIGLIVLLYTMGVSVNEEYFAAYLVLFISTVILLLPIIFIKSLPKLMASILMNISINGFVLYVFLIFGLISMHQNDACYDSNYNRIYKDCTTLLEKLDINTSYILFAAGILFIFFYTAVIKKWRAQPE